MTLYDLSVRSIAICGLALLTMFLIASTSPYYTHTEDPEEKFAKTGAPVLLGIFLILWAIFVAPLVGD